MVQVDLERSSAPAFSSHHSFTATDRDPVLDSDVLIRRLQILRQPLPDGSDFDFKMPRHCVAGRESQGAGELSNSAESLPPLPRIQSMRESVSNVLRKSKGYNKKVDKRREYKKVRSRVALPLGNISVCALYRYLSSTGLSLLLTYGK